MNTIRRRLVPLAAVALLLGLATAAGAEDGLVEYVEGEVWIESSGTREIAATREIADFGSSVSAGDLVITGSDGIAIVAVGAGSQIKLREDTVVEIHSAATRGSV